MLLLYINKIKILTVNKYLLELTSNVQFKEVVQANIAYQAMTVFKQLFKKLPFLKN